MSCIKKIVTDLRNLKMSKPIRIQRTRKHKQVSPNGLPIVYVGRPSKWGNPFKVGSIIRDDITGEAKKELKTIREVIDWYKFYITFRKMNDIIKKELKGKNLSCWCKVGEPCHADILLEIANK